MLRDAYNIFHFSSFFLHFVFLQTYYHPLDFRVLFM
jgi:hypothetical protein